jgi:hypothetical protein
MDGYSATVLVFDCVPLEVLIACVSVLRFDPDTLSTLDLAHYSMLLSSAPHSIRLHRAEVDFTRSSRPHLFQKMDLQARRIATDDLFAEGASVPPSPH